MEPIHIRAVLLARVVGMAAKHNLYTHTKERRHDMAKIRLFRYRRPSVKTILGVTKAKKRIKKQLGITAVMRPLRAPGNAKRRVLRQVGYYSGPMKFLRFLMGKR